MRNFALGLIALFTLTFSLTSSAVPAQAAGSLVVTIPFEFKVGDETLPAGKYLVGSPSIAGSFIVVQSAEEGPSAAALTGGSLRSNRRSSAPKLVFKVYGGVHFLSEVWTGYGGTGVEVSTSEEERALAKAGAKEELVAVVAR
jgi:hypothetical protein